MALVLCRPLFKLFISNANLKYLLDNGCDSTLYNLLEYASSRAKCIQYLIRVEGSTKVDKDPSKTVAGRCTVTMLLEQWDSYLTEDQDLVLKYLGFTRRTLQQFRTRYNYLIDDDTDIIFGKAGSIGKIYFDFGKINLDAELAIVCLESTGKIKHYSSCNDKTVPKGTHIAYCINPEGGPAQPETVHYPGIGQEYNGYPVSWTGEGLQSKTYYTRPKYIMWLSEIYNFTTLIIHLHQQLQLAHCTPFAQLPSVLSRPDRRPSS
jgi:hypothetical protein